jgi:DNA-binding NarL/FixJ family response regulator
LLVDDSWRFLGSAEHFLATEPDVEVVGCASSGREALDQVPLLRPDVVLMDVAMPHMNGLLAGRLLKAMPHGPRVVLLSVNDHPGCREEAKAIGADAFLSKSELGSRLMPLIRTMFARAPV